MIPQLVALSGSQGGVFTRRQALEGGVSPREIRRLTRDGGDWVVVRRGAYAERERWDEMDAWTDRPAARDWAAHLTMHERHVMSHDSAGRAYGLSLLRPRKALVHVTRPGVGGSRTEHGVKHHLSQGLPWQWSFAGGLPVTPLARTALDIGREHGLWAGTAAVDSAMRRGADADDFHRHLRQMRHWPYITQSKSAVALGDPGAENAGETMSRLLVGELGVVDVQSQYPIRLADGRVVWVDLIAGCHVFEFDGKMKYQRRQDGGVADLDASDVVWAEKDRERLIRAEGLGVSRIVWDDFWGTARRVARDRLRSEVGLTRERHGERRPTHLDEFAAQMEEVRRRRIFSDWRGNAAG